MQACQVHKHIKLWQQKHVSTPTVNQYQVYNLVVTFLIYR